MNVYVFGNEYVEEDKRAIEVARDLEDTVEGISFVLVDPNEDVPFVDEPRVVVLDTVQGLQDVALVEGDEFDGLLLSPLESFFCYQHCEVCHAATVTPLVVVPTQYLGHLAVQDNG